MQKFKIMNVLLSSDPQFVGSPQLLFRTEGILREKDPGCWEMQTAACYDFTTFFNAISLGKWRTYTVARKYGVHLELKGAACTIAQTRADSFSWYAEEIPDTSLDVAASSTWTEVDFELACNEHDVIEAFKITTSGAVQIRGGYYYALVDESDVREVELALCTTTFKKEEYITRNIKLVKDQVLGCDDLVANHLTMHVVDNGRTLDVDELEAERIHVHPNDNAGGAGGFARGMICAMEQEPKATHVLLMDDDVLISTESIKRTYNLLSIVNDEYAEAFVSGAMMNLDEPNVRWEEMGYIARDGDFFPLKPVAYMDTLHEVVVNEAYREPSDIPGYEDQAQHYAAWWYCVIPMTTIERFGLPLPIFVRGDDVEYSRRCNPKFMTMNGICIWHLAFHMRYSAAQERYQMIRNCFIDQYASSFAPLSDFEAKLKRALELELKKYNYSDAELILKGFEDFLRGPAWIMQPVAQQAFMDANAQAEHLKPFSELAADVAELGIDLNSITVWDLENDLPRSRTERLEDYLTINSQRFGSRPNTGKVAIITAAGWEYPAGKIRKAETIVAIDAPTRRGIVRHPDSERFNAIMNRYKEDLKLYKEKREQLLIDYTAAHSTMTSVAFWKDYLGIS
ncbi:MAG: glycosyltransferase, partial [Coriobacteriales bacterium]|nr:glycosyltransferase [Coriobacteriales bacterium]